MNKEEKELLVKVLCEMLPYRTKVEVCIKDKDIKSIDCVKYNTVGTYIGLLDEEKFSVKPYLRPMSSMTEEESKEFEETLQYTQLTLESYDWLNAHHFDYRGLIEKGLAIKAPKGMYDN